MKRLLRWVLILGVIFGGLWAISGPLGAYMKARNRVVFREVDVTRGRVVAVINATGTVKPVQSVSIGSFVSGPIVKIGTVNRLVNGVNVPEEVDFNSPVKKGDLLALVDPKIYKADVDRDEANLEITNAAVVSAQATVATRQAEIEQAEARLKQAIADEKRAKNLQKENPNFVSKTEMDKLEFDIEALAAGKKVAERIKDQAKAAVDQAKAQVKQATANLEQSKIKLDYTKIVSPVDGIVIDRKIDPGQTMAASFQTPELFIVAPDLRKEIRVFASVDEADIGYLIEAEKEGQPVHFTVDAYPDELFPGKILRDSGIRMNSTVTQNVVTYPVVLTAANGDLKLRPGMTANISFQLKEKDNALRIPNAALRFYPQREQVRPEDRELLENKGSAKAATEEGSAVQPSAELKAEMRRKRNSRHVWVVDGEFLRAVPVITGLSDSQHTELVGGELREHDKLVTGILPKR